jgi:hypothetical protein
MVMHGIVHERNSNSSAVNEHASPVTNTGHCVVSVLPILIRRTTVISIRTRKRTWTVHLRCMVLLSCSTSTVGMVEAFAGAGAGLPVRFAKQQHSKSTFIASDYGSSSSSISRSCRSSSGSFSLELLLKGGRRRAMSTISNS